MPDSHPPLRSALPEYDVVLTVRNPQRPGMIGRLLGLVGDLGDAVVRLDDLHHFLPFDIGTKRPLVVLLPLLTFNF